MLVRNTVVRTPSVEADRIALATKALAHPARVRIVSVLPSTPGCIGGGVVDEAGLAQSTVCEQLWFLKDAGIATGAMGYPRVRSLDPVTLAPIRTPKEASPASAPTAKTLNCHILQSCTPRMSTL